MPLASITAIDLINYRQHFIHTERLEATSVNRKIQAVKKLFGSARQSGHMKTDVSTGLRFLPSDSGCAAALLCRRCPAGEACHPLARRLFLPTGVSFATAI